MGEREGERRSERENERERVCVREISLGKWIKAPGGISRGRNTYIFWGGQ